jgi:tRNA 2-thiouridine synthesizing protein A
MTKPLDLKGLKCPLPVLRAKKALKGMTPGALLEVLATDPGSVKDFQAFCETTGDEMVSWSEVDGVYRYTLRKKSEN